MEWKLELVAIPVSDVDRAKAFYTEKVGFNADHDHRVSDEVRFVQPTPPGSACSIALGTGISRAEPGSVQGMQMVVPDVEAARGARRARGGGQRGTGVRLGLVRVLQRPGRQRLGRAAAARSRVGKRKEDEHG